MAALEQVRDIFDRDSAGMVSIVMPGLKRRLAGSARPDSRIGLVHEFRPLVQAKFRPVPGGWRPPGVAQPEALMADAERIAAPIRLTG